MVPVYFLHASCSSLSLSLSRYIEKRLCSRPLVIGMVKYYYVCVGVLCDLPLPLCKPVYMCVNANYLAYQRERMHTDVPPFLHTYTLVCTLHTFLPQICYIIHRMTK